MLGLIQAGVIAAVAHFVYGPYFAHVNRVIDGDTLDVTVEIWPQHVVNTKVRIRGIDTPELRSRMSCEKELAKVARDRVVGLVDGTTVMIENVKYGAYTGRVIADVFLAGEDLAELLLQEGYARPYDGKHSRRSLGAWCGEGA